MRLPLNHVPHPFIQQIESYYQYINSTSYPDTLRSISFEFDQPARIHDLYVSLPPLTSGTEGKISVSVYIKYKRTEDEGGYSEYLLRTYIQDSTTSLKSASQGSHLEGEIGEHTEMPKVLPGNSIITFQVLDERTTLTENSLFISEVGVIASSLVSSYPGMM